MCQAPEAVRLSSREKCLGQPYTRNVIWPAVRANDDCYRPTSLNATVSIQDWRMLTEEV
jgi:hypothetical protein